MSREGFLKEVWRPYPSVRETEGYFFGRVMSLMKDSFEIYNQRDCKKILSSELKNEIKNEYYGSSIPFLFLQEGDAVAFSLNESALFLLAPCTKKHGQLFEDSPAQWSLFLEKVEGFF